MLCQRQMVKFKIKAKILSLRFSKKNNCSDYNRSMNLSVEYQTQMRTIFFKGSKRFRFKF